MDKRPAMEMKRVRYEVMKFSSSKLEGREREEADVALAVSLGAMPPKKEYTNYRELLQKRAKEKEEEKADVKPRSIAKLKAKLKKSKDVATKDRGRKKGKVKGRKGNKVAILHSYGKLSKDKRKR
jgi:hypothetical protein